LFRKILIANRSEIAVRVINACKTLGIPTVAVYSEADKSSVHRRLADESVMIGPPPPGKSYLDMDKIIDAARRTNADAIHPGYGFLAENPLLAERCVEAGITFIGPPPDVIRLMGNKVAARTKMKAAGVPLIPGMSQTGTDLNAFKKTADKVGYPVLIKAAAGGGGKGMRVVQKAEELSDALAGADRVALERALQALRKK